MNSERTIQTGKAVQSPVFEQTFRYYLKQLSQIDYCSRAALLGVSSKEDSLLIPLYDRRFLVNQHGVTSIDGASVTAAVRVILCRYILSCPSELPQNKEHFMTFREFKDAGPLTSFFTANTNKTIESAFGGKLQELVVRTKQIGGTPRADESYDFSAEFFALPRVPVVVNFNDRDELFPATCSILYKSSAECFLDMECLAMTGTLLAGKLISPLDR